MAGEKGGRQDERGEGGVIIGEEDKWKVRVITEVEVEGR